MLLGRSAGLSLPAGWLGSPPAHPASPVLLANDAIGTPTNSQLRCANLGLRKGKEFATRPLWLALNTQ